MVYNLKDLFILAIMLREFEEMVDL